MRSMTRLAIAMIVLAATVLLGSGCTVTEELRAEKCEDHYVLKAGVAFDVDECRGRDIRSDGQLADAVDHCALLPNRSSDKRCKGMSEADLENNTVGYTEEPDDLTPAVNVDPPGHPLPTEPPPIPGGRVLQFLPEIGKVLGVVLVAFALAFAWKSASASGRTFRAKISGVAVQAMLLWILVTIALPWFVDYWLNLGSRETMSGPGGTRGLSLVAAIPFGILAMRMARPTGPWSYWGSMALMLVGGALWSNLIWSISLDTGNGMAFVGAFLVAFILGIPAAIGSGLVFQALDRRGQKPAGKPVTRDGDG